MVKHKDAYDGDKPLSVLAAEIDNKHKENEENLTVRKKRELAKKAKSFTTRWGQVNYEATMKAFYDEVARLAGRMERWKREELATRGMAAMDEYHNDINRELFDSPFDLVDEAVRLKAHIPRLRYRALTELDNLAYEARTLEGDEEKAKKIEAEAKRIIREKMPAAGFRIYEIWCEVGEVIKQDSDKRMVLKLSDYEDYDFEYKEED